MLIQETKEKLFERITQNIIKHNFVYVKRDDSFKRNIDNSIIQTFTLLFTKKEEGIYIEPYIRVKIKQIEDIYHKICLKEPKYFDSTCTLGINLFKLIDYMDNKTEIDTDNKKRYLVENKDDIEILKEVIPKRFDEYVLSYLDENSSVAKVDELLNKHPREISIHNWLYPVRACIGLIAAKLNSNQNYEGLLAIYSKEMQEAAEPYKEEFFKLQEVLDSL